MSVSPLSYFSTGETLIQAFPEVKFQDFKFKDMRIPDKTRISTLFCDRTSLSFPEVAASDFQTAVSVLQEVIVGDFVEATTALSRRTLRTQEVQIPWSEQISVFESLKQFPSARMRVAMLTLFTASMEISAPEISDSRRLVNLIYPSAFSSSSKAVAVLEAISLARLLCAHAEISDHIVQATAGTVLREALVSEAGGVGEKLAGWFRWCTEKNPLFGASEEFRVLHATNFLNVVMKVIGNFSSNWAQIPHLATNLPEILRPLVDRKIAAVLWASEELSLVLGAFVGMFPLHLSSFLEILAILGEQSRKFLAENSVQSMILPRNFRDVNSVEEAVLRLYGFFGSEIYSSEFTQFNLDRKFHLDGNFLWRLISAGAEICASGNLLTDAQKALVAGALEISANLEIFPDEETELWMARNLWPVIGNFFSEIWLRKSPIPLRLIGQTEKISDSSEIIAHIVGRATAEELERNYSASEKILRMIGNFDEANFRLATALLRKGKDKKFPISRKICDLLDENSEYAVRGREFVRGRKKFPDTLVNEALVFLSEISSWRSEISSSLIVDAMRLCAEKFPDAPRALKQLLAGRNFRVTAAHADLIEKILANSETSDSVVEPFARPGIPQRLQISLVEKFHESADAVLAAYLRVPSRDISGCTFPTSLVPKFTEGCMRLLALGLGSVESGDRKSELVAKARSCLQEFSIGNFFRNEQLAISVRLLVEAVAATGGAVDFPRSLQPLSSAAVISDCKKFPTAAAAGLEALGEWLALSGTAAESSYESEISSLRGVLGTGEFLGERIATAAAVLLALLEGRLEFGRAIPATWLSPILIDFESARISDLQELVSKAANRKTVELAIHGVCGASEGKFQELGPWLGSWMIGNFAEFPDAGLLLMWRLAMEARSSVIGNFREIGIRFVQTWREKFLWPWLTAASEGSVDSLGRATQVVSIFRALGLPFNVEHLIGLLGASENLEFPIFFCTTSEQKIAASVLPGAGDEKISEPAMAPSILHQTAEFLVLQIFEEAVLSGESEISFDLCLEIVARLKNLLLKHKTDPQATLVVMEGERVPLSVDKFVDDKVGGDRKSEDKISDILSLFEVKKRAADQKPASSKNIKTLDARNISRFPTIPDSLAISDWVDAVGNVAAVALLRAYETATKEEQVLSLFDLMEVLKTEAVLRGKAEIALEELIARLKPHIFLEEEVPAAIAGGPVNQPVWTEVNPALPW